MEILHADNHLIVVNKRAGLATESLEGASLEEEVKVWVKEKYQKKGEVFVRAVHRLDKLVSGIVVLAKTSKALVRLQASFRHKETKKRYLALVERPLAESSGQLEDYLVHGEFRAVVADPLDPKAKKASLSYSVQDSFLQIDLHTGRYHQIRAQLASRGHPVVNDVKYGAKRVSAVPMIGLHHHSLQVPHPISKEVLSFEVPFPDEWRSCFSDFF